MIEQIYYIPVETAWGSFLLASTDKGICRIQFLRDHAEDFFSCWKKSPGIRGNPDKTSLQDAARELKEYLSGRRRGFESPLDLRGTPFQLKVWEQLRRIPYGETASYGEIAKAVGVPKGARAVGMANNANPVLLMVPCHRVIGSSGALAGYRYGLDLKQKLLHLEKG